LRDGSRGALTFGRPNRKGVASGRLARFVDEDQVARIQPGGHRIQLARGQPLRSGRSGIAGRDAWSFFMGLVTVTVEELPTRGPTTSRHCSAARGSPISERVGSRASCQLPQIEVRVLWVEHRTLRLALLGRRKSRLERDSVRTRRPPCLADRKGFAALAVTATLQCGQPHAPQIPWRVGLPSIPPTCCRGINHGFP